MAATVAPVNFNNYNAYLRLRFGGRTVKISLDLGIPCPHRKLHPPGCTYCRPGVIMAERIGRLGTITDQINGSVMGLAARYKTGLFLAYFQNESNTAGDLEWLLARYDEALAHPKVSGIIVSTRPDMMPDALLDFLQLRSRRKPVFIEYGLQSAHDATLARINRGHDVATFADAVKRTHAHNLPVAAHAILGLPGETPEMMIDTFRFLGGLPIDSLKIHHLQIYRNSPLEIPWLNGEVRIFERFSDYLPVLLDCLEVLPWRIKIQRLIADAPRDVVLAPRWTTKKNEIIAAVEAGFAERGSKQGAKADTRHVDLRLL